MGVTFDEEQPMVQATSIGVSGLYALVIRWGFAKDEKQANIVLLVTAISMVLLAAGILIVATGTGDSITTEEYLNNGNIVVPPAP